MESLLLKYSFKHCKQLWTCSSLRKLLRVSPLNALNTLTKLKKELGVKPAVRLLSTDSFCASIETLLPHLTTLKKELGVEPAVRLLSTNSFCAAIDKLLPHLAKLKKELGVEPGVPKK